MEHSKDPAIDDELLPDISSAEMDFHDTSFFQTPYEGSPRPQLPSPALVREQSDNDPRGIVKLEHLNLVVKFGSPPEVSLEEAQALRLLRQAFSRNEVPVPELYGWRVSEGKNFIYMSLIRGPTLRESWPSLTPSEKGSIRDQLGQIVATLRQLKQKPHDSFIGSINRGLVQDNYFYHGHEAGPFHSVKAFNDWVQSTAIPTLPVKDRPFDPYRTLLPDACHIYFCHGDLNLGNIILKGSHGSRRISGIVDWEQAGWYPEYWEYCKLLFAVPYTHEWRSAGWADGVMECYEDEFLAFGEYWCWRCP